MHTHVLLAACWRRDGVTWNCSRLSQIRLRRQRNDANNGHDKKHQLRRAVKNSHLCIELLFRKINSLKAQSTGWGNVILGDAAALILKI